MALPGGGAGAVRGLLVGMGRPRIVAINRIAARQHGVISRAQLLLLGFAPTSIDWMIESQRLRVLHRGVYLLGALQTPLTTAMAAVIACGDGAVLSHSSAARQWRLAVNFPRAELVHVTVAGRDPGSRRGVRVHRVRRLGPDEVTEVQRVPITNPSRTLLDLAPDLPTWELERALSDALRRRLLRTSQLEALLARYPQRHGTPAIRHLLEAEHGPAFTRRELELRFLALVRSAGLPVPEVNVELGPYEVDFLWRAQRLVVETDGWQFHSDRRAFENDRRRDAELVARGFRVVRVTWRELANAPAAVVARIAAALAASGAVLPERG